MTNKLFCSHCGEVIENEENGIYINRSFYTRCFCCEECAELEGFHQCE